MELLTSSASPQTPPPVLSRNSAFFLPEVLALCFSAQQGKQGLLGLVACCPRSQPPGLQYPYLYTEMTVPVLAGLLLEFGIINGCKVYIYLAHYVPLRGLPKTSAGGFCLQGYVVVELELSLSP